MKHDEHGFTMIELLIVIVILGILAGIVVYAVAGTTNNAASQSCKTEAHQFVNGYVAYQANHGGTPVTGATTAVKGANLFADHVLSSGTFTYLAASDGGPVVNAGAPQWTFDVTKVSAVLAC